MRGIADINDALAPGTLAQNLPNDGQAAQTGIENAEGLRLMPPGSRLAVCLARRLSLPLVLSPAAASDDRRLRNRQGFGQALRPAQRVDLLALDQNLNLCAGRTARPSPESIRSPGLRRYRRPQKFLTKAALKSTVASWLSVLSVQDRTRVPGGSGESFSAAMAFSEPSTSGVVPTGASVFRQTRYRSVVAQDAVDAGGRSLSRHDHGRQGVREIDPRRPEPVSALRTPFVSNDVGFPVRASVLVGTALPAVAATTARNATPDGQHR